MKGVSLIIPALNEEKSIAQVITDTESSLKAADMPFEIIVVDDGSDDQTSAIAIRHNVQLIKHPARGGYGMSLRDGIFAAKYDWIAIIDADQSYPAKRIGEFVKYLKDFDMVVGARTGKAYQESLIKFPMRKVFHSLCEFVTGRKIPDANSGFRAFRKETVMKFKDNFCLGFSFTTTITLAFHLNGYFVKYIPIDYYERKGKSHVKLIQDSLRTTQIITQAILYYNPIKLFLLLWIVTLLTAGLCFLIYFFTHNLVAIILGQAFVIVAFLYLGMGFLAEILRERKN